MRVKSWLILGASAFLLTACNDVIQFPGAQNGDKEETRDGPGPAPPTEPASGSTTTLPDADIDADTTTDTDVTPTETDAEDVTEADTEADTTDPVLIPASLGEINAKICAASEFETMTIAQLTGASLPAEPVFGTATVDGAIAHRVDFPGIVKMEPKTDMTNGGIASGHCGATRIAEHWFITAAHCLDERYDRVELIVGVDTLSSPLAKTVIADTTVCHNSYGGSRSQYANDIALVHVGDAALADLADVPIARFGNSLKPLGAANYTTVDMAGWGLTGFDENLSNDLLTAKLTLTGAGPAIVNVASLEGSGPCVGDSGGPLYVTEADGSKTVVGVLSVVEQNPVTGGFCEGAYNGRYTNLQGFADWINDVISACDASDELCVALP